jgi:hypothetical protein
LHAGKWDSIKAVKQILVGGDMKIHVHLPLALVSGARAHYRSVGTINGAGTYGFLLTAIDGQLNGGGGTDKFRIKIWEKIGGIDGDTVYDNQMDALDTGDASTALGGGSIVIHTK